MEVTCERCSTVYDFDDALVSERGTSVKCTTCGHQFKVRRAAAGTVPDKWLVRTVDGREIEFSALRELQSAIHEGKVTRDDVLARGNSRPRRLGSIAELDPFFNRIGMTVPGTGTTPPPAARSRNRTPAGIGGSTQPPQRTDGSVVIPLPGVGRAMQAGAAAAPPRPPSVPPAPPLAMGGALLGRPGSVRPAAPVRADRSGDVPAMPAPRVPQGLEELNTMDVVESSVSTGGSEGLPPPPPMRAASGSSPALSSDDRAPSSNRSGVERISVLPPPPPPPRKPTASSPMFPPPEQAPPPRKPTASSPMFPPPEDPPPPPPPPPPPARRPMPSSPSVQDAGPQSGDDPTLMMERPPQSADGPTLMMERPPMLAAAKPAAAKPAPSKVEAPKAEASNAEVSSVETTRPPVSSASSRKPPSSLPISSPLSTSQPGDDGHADSRFSGSVEPRRPHGARWIVGVLVLGLGVLGVVTVRKYMPTTNPVVQPKEDPRLVPLLEQGDRSLRDGDFEGANEAYAKASALAEGDLRVAVRRARLAAVRADVPWLKVRLLPEGSAELDNAKRELEIAVGRAKEAAQHAHAIAPADADVTRCLIEARRLEGDVEGARKLVAQLPKGAPQPTDELLFAELDLSEATPVWATVVERLRAAARDEQNLGRARAMLIYALARSGDAAGAKAELDKLVALSRPHPLAPALGTFLTNGGGGAGGAGALVPDGKDPLEVVAEAIEKGELEKAEEVLKGLAEKTPNDVKVLTAQAELALKKKDRAGAIKLYERAIAADKSHLPAFAGLADIKWENGERMTASTLYRQIIEKGGDKSPYAKRAKERLSIFIDSWEPR